MVFTRPETVEVQKKDLRRLYRLAEDTKGNWPDAVDRKQVEETVTILRRLLQMDKYDRYEPED